MLLASKIAPALLLSALLFAPAAAAPVGPNTMGSPDSLLIQVKGGHGGHGGKGHGGHGKNHGGRGHRGGKAHHGHGNRHHGNRGHHYHGGNWHRGGGRWVAGRTYYVAPAGWRQYGARPWNWQALGCVVVNGFWFCP